MGRFWKMDSGDLINTIGKIMKWVKCSDQMPGIKSGQLLVTSKNNPAELAYFIAYEDGYYFCIGSDTKQTWQPTHWMPLPEIMYEEK